MTIQDAWLLVGVVAALAAFAMLWAVVTARAALQSRRVLLDGVRALGKGDTSRRLSEKVAGAHVAREFDQAARDLGERLIAAEKTAQTLRLMGATLPRRVVLGLDGADEIREVLGDVEAMLGSGRELLLGREAAALFASEEDWRGLRQAGPSAEPLRLAARRLDGELLMCDVRLVETRPDDASAASVMLELAETGHAADMEEQLEQARQHVQAITCGIADAIALIVDGRIGSANPAMAALLRTDPASLAGRPVTELVAPGEVVRVPDLLRESQPGTHDLTLRTPDGEDVRVEVSVGQAEAGGVRFQVLIARDVTRRKATEERLELYGAWLGAALEASGDGLLVLARRDAGAWPVALTNTAGARLLGLEEGRLPNRDEIDGALDRFADPQMVRAFLGSFEADDAGADGEGIFEISGEPPRILQIETVPVRDADGVVVGRLLTLRDCTARQRLESELRREAGEMQAALDELQRSTADLGRGKHDLESQVEKLEVARRELMELDEMKTNLLGNVSHELQTPLVSIKGYTEMMLRGDLGEITADQRQGLEVCNRNIKRLINIIEQLLILTRTEEKLTDLTLEEFPLWQVLDETISLLGDRIRTRGLRVTTRYDTDRLTVLADRNLISQVFVNLLGNAVKYNREGGEVAVTVRGSGPDELVVEIKDTGVGIPRAEQQRIFDRGFRASTAGSTRGSGIGLSLVREILKRHGSQIRVDSRSDKGSTFSLTLPLAPPDEMIGTGAMAADDPPAGSAAGR